MMPRCMLKIITLLCLAAPAFATTTYLQAKEYLDVTNGKMIKPANILIENGKIKAINPSQVPADAVRIAKPNLILLPGLMDMHVHLPFDYDRDFELRHVQDDDAMATVRGVKNARTVLMAGFTTVRNLGQIYPSESFIDVALANASDKGWIVAPHIIPSGHALSITGGHLDPTGGYAPNTLTISYRTGIADGKDEVIKSVRYQIKHGVKVIKAAATAGVLSSEAGAGNQQYTEEEIHAMVEEAARHQIPVTVHAHGTAGINAAIKAGVRSVEHGSLLNDESITLMKQHGTYLVPTSYVLQAINPNDLSPVMREKAEYLLPLARQNLKKAVKAGVKIAFGTDGPIVPFGQNAKEFSTLVQSGLTSLQAIQAATINSADMMKLKDRGQIKTGLRADIIGVSANPLDNIKTLEKVDFVMKDGVIVKNQA